MHFELNAKPDLAYNEKLDFERMKGNKYTWLDIFMGGRYCGHLLQQRFSDVGQR